MNSGVRALMVFVTVSQFLPNITLAKSNAASVHTASIHTFWSKRVGPRGGRAPAFCPGATSPVVLPNNPNPAIGHSPVYATGPWSGPQARLGFGDWGLSTPGDYYRIQLVRLNGERKEAWAQKVPWEVVAPLTQSVTVSGRETTSGRPLWFRGPGDTKAVRTRLVIPAGYRGFPSTMYITELGCYRLTVDWGTDHWTRTFADGYVAPSPRTLKTPTSPVTIGNDPI